MAASPGPWACVEARGFPGAAKQAPPERERVLFSRSCRPRRSRLGSRNANSYPRAFSQAAFVEHINQCLSHDTFLKEHGYLPIEREGDGLFRALSDGVLLWCVRAHLRYSVVAEGRLGGCNRTVPPAWERGWLQFARALSVLCCVCTHAVLPPHLHILTLCAASSSTM